MTFTSVPFLWFFAAFLVVYSVVPARFRSYVLLLGGLVFAFWNSVLGAVILLCFTVVNFLFGILVQSGETRSRSFMLLGVAVNVIALVVFKLIYKLTGAAPPLGISFYTFACIAYLVDIERGTHPAEQNPIKFVTYTTMFPKLLQGPITRYSEIGEQLDKPKYTLRNIQSGLTSFVIGFAMKVLVADKLGYLWNDLGTIGYDSISTPLAWYGLFGYSLQIYLDWQGYTLMAVGIGRMLGFTLPQNFNYPYLARTVGEYYRRWHMTLTRWFKDYVYIPLGGNRKGTLRTCLNILIVWTLTALWHGFGLNFLFWGLSLGILIVLEKLFLNRAFEKLHVLPHLYVLFFIPLTWCCFAISKTADLGAYFSRLFPFFGTWGNVNPRDFSMRFLTYLPYFAVGIVLSFPVVENLLHKISRNWIGAILLGVLFWLAVYEMQRTGSNVLMYINF